MNASPEELASLPFERIAERSLSALYALRVQSTPDLVAVQTYADAAWQPWTWAELQTAADRLSGALAEAGVRRGTHVGLMTSPRVEGLIATMAIHQLGAIPCGIYSNTDGETLRYLAGLADLRVLLIEREEQLDRALAAADDIPVDLAIVFDGVARAGSGRPDRRQLGEILNGPEVSWQLPGPPASADDPSSVYFTSGTTGRPKAVVLSHRNILSSYFAPFGKHDGQLPPPNSSDRTLHDIQLGSVAGAVFGLFFPLVYGCTAWVAPESRDLYAVLQEAQPTLFLAFPRTWEQLARQVAGALESGQAATPHEALATAGLGCVKYALCGGLADAAVQQWREWGIVVRGIYGMNETGGLATMQTGGDPPPGGAGRALPGMELILDEEGEILVRGAGIFSGYLGRPDATADVLDADGWLHTGDIGTLDADGNLRVVDRKNDLIVLADGTTVSTSEVAGALKRSRYVRDALVVGTDRKFCGVLIEPNLDALRVWASTSGREALPDHDLTRAETTQTLMAGVVEEASNYLAAHGKPEIGSFRIMPRELDPDDPTEVTATRKLRRQHLAVKFSELIDDLYQVSSGEG